MKEALIWGASGGMGNALVSTLKEAGWRVYAAARDLERVPAVADDAFTFEAGDESSIKEVALALAHQTDGLDLSVYAAGGLSAELLRKMDFETWNEVLASNLDGAFLTAGHTVQLMKEGASMIFIGAYLDHLILPKMGAYAVAKAGLEQMVPILAKENRKINFFLVRPGAVDTPFWENAPFRRPKDSKAPQDVARAILARHEGGATGDLNL